MGYYTYHTMSVRGANLTQETADALNVWLKENGVLDYALEEGYLTDPEHIEFDGADTVKWYDYAEDMLACCKAFPDLTFCVHGEGENSGDIWDHYFRNGESELCVAQIIIPKPDCIQWP